MTATLSPAQDYLERKKRSVDAEDVLFKSLQGLQERRNSTNHRQQRKNSMDTAGMQREQRHSTASYRTKRRNSIGAGTGLQERRNSINHRQQRKNSMDTAGMQGEQRHSPASHQTKRRNSIGRSTSTPRARSSDGRTPRNAATSFGTRSCHGVATKPRSLHLDDRQLSGGKVRQAHRLGRRASTGMPSDHSSNFQSNVRCVTPTRSEKYNVQSGGVPRRMSGGARMAQDCPRNIPGSFSSCIQTNVRLFTPISAGVQPPSLGTHSSDGNPRRMRRRGSVSPTRAAAGTQPPNIKRQSSGGTPGRMPRRGSTGMAPESKPGVISTPKMKQSNVPLSVSLHGDASSTPGDSRRMLRRGSSGMGHDGEGRRSSGHNNMNWGWGSPPGAPLQNGRRSNGSPGEATRKRTRMRRRASTGMDQHAGVDPVIVPKPGSHRSPSHTNSPKTPVSQRKSGSKPHGPGPAAGVTCAPGVIRSFKRSSTSMSSASMTSTTTVMSSTSFENFAWGNGDTNIVAEDCTA